MGVIGASATPDADFTNSPSEPVPDEPVTLDASASSSADGEIVDYEWDLDDDGDFSGDSYGGDVTNRDSRYDGSASGETVDVEFDSGGTYTIALRVTDETGETDTVRKSIEVTNEAPTAEFTASPSVPVPDEPVTLDASDSVDSDGEIVDYDWDLDDDGDFSGDSYGGDVTNRDSRYDGSASGDEVNLAFDTGGSYRITLRVTDNGGETTRVTETIEVTNEDPSPEFTFSPSGPVPDEPVTLDASDSVDTDGDIVDYDWDLDGDGDFSGDSYGGDVTNKDGRYDGSASGDEVTVEFDTGGSYRIALRVTDNGGETSTVTETVEVTNDAPIAWFTSSPTEPVPDEPVTLDASDSVDSDGDIVDYDWDLDDDGDFSGDSYGGDVTNKGGRYDGSASGDEVNLEFDTGGSYRITLRVTDNGGETTRLTETIEVTNDAPTPRFTFSPSGPVPDEPVTLDAVDSVDPDGDIVDYDWDLDGDGEFSGDSYGGGVTNKGGRYDGSASGDEVNLAFDTEGTYRIALRVTDNGGETVTVTETIEVTNEAPSPEFTFSPTDPVPDEPVTLDAGDSVDPDGEIVDYDWDLDGDGEFSGDSYGNGDVTNKDGRNDGSASGDEVNLEFDTEGTYRIALRVTDNGGKESTVTGTVEVTNEAPRPSFGPSGDLSPDKPVTLDAGDSVDPDGEIVDYDWDLDGDGEFSGDSRGGDVSNRDGRYDGSATGETAAVEFDTAGSYRIALRVTDNGGETTEITETVEITNEPPNASFSHRLLPGGALDLELNASPTTDADGEIVDYDWYVDGTRVDSGPAPTIEFEERGTHEFTLVVTDNGEERDRVTETIGVSRPPDPVLDASSDPAGVGQSVVFNASESSHPTGRIDAYRWTFSDDNSRTGETVSKSFAEVGTYEVTLTVVDDMGVSVTETKTLRVKEPPSASLAWEPETPTTDQDVVFRADSPATIEAFRWDFDDDREFDAEGETVTHSFTEFGRHAVTMHAVDTDGVPRELTEVVTVERRAAYELTADRSNVTVGEEAIVEFSVSNRDPDQTLEAKLDIAVPDGVSVTSVQGTDLASTSATDFVTVPAGDEKTLRVHLQVNEPGDHEIGGEAVYYFDRNESNDRRTAAIEPVQIGGEADDEDATPGFDGATTVAALIASLIGYAIRRTR